MTAPTVAIFVGTPPVANTRAMCSLYDAHAGSGGLHLVEEGEYTPGRTIFCDPESMQ